MLYYVSTVLHGRDPCAACDHADSLLGIGSHVISLVRDGEFTAALVCQVALGSLHQDRVADLQAIQMLTQFAY